MVLFACGGAYYSCDCVGGGIGYWVDEDEDEEVDLRCTENGGVCGLVMLGAKVMVAYHVVVFNK